MFKTKERLDKIDKRLRRVERYCESLDRHQDQIYFQIVTELTHVYNSIDMAMNHLERERKNREDAFKIFKEENNAR